VKPSESKPVEVEKVETPASAAAEEATPEKTEEAAAAVVESAEAPSAPAGESNDAPADAVQESTEESAPAAEEKSESPEPEESGAEEAGDEAPEIKVSFLSPRGVCLVITTIFFRLCSRPSFLFHVSFTSTHSSVVMLIYIVCAPA